MTKHPPFISIIIPTYNRAIQIIETLQSVQNQTYNHWECIVVDDGSTDDTEERVTSFIANDNRFKWVKRPNKYKAGGCGARNYGFHLSKGDYINWLDSDDLLKPQKLENQVNLLRDNPADLAICEWQMFDEQHQLSRRSYIAEKKPANGLEIIKLMGELRTVIFPHNYLVKRSVIEKSGLWNEYLKINQDGEFYCRVLIYSDTVVSDPQITCLYRIHNGDRISTLNKAKSLHRVHSWKLIESYLKLIDQDYFNEYIEFNKTVLYAEVYDKGGADILKQNNAFFKQQLRQYPFWKLKAIHLYQKLKNRSK